MPEAEVRPPAEVKLPIVPKNLWNQSDQEFLDWIGNNSAKATVWHNKRLELIGGGLPSDFAKTGTDQEFLEAWGMAFQLMEKDLRAMPLEARKRFEIISRGEQVPPAVQPTTEPQISAASQATAGQESAHQPQEKKSKRVGYWATAAGLTIVLAGVAIWGVNNIDGDTATRVRQVLNEQTSGAVVATPLSGESGGTPQAGVSLTPEAPQILQDAQETVAPSPTRGPTETLQPTETPQPPLEKLAKELGVEEIKDYEGDVGKMDLIRDFAYIVDLKGDTDEETIKKLQGSKYWETVIKEILFNTSTIEEGGKITRAALR